MVIRAGREFPSTWVAFHSCQNSPHPAPSSQGSVSLVQQDRSLPRGISSERSRYPGSCPSALPGAEPRSSPCRDREVEIGWFLPQESPEFLRVVPCYSSKASTASPHGFLLQGGHVGDQRVGDRRMGAGLWSPRVPSPELGLSLWDGCGSPHPA